MKHVVLTDSLAILGLELPVLEEEDWHTLESSLSTVHTFPSPSNPRLQYTTIHNISIHVEKTISVV